ncbi:MAG: Gfo/Idh/MocA family oxidoreductase [Pirellulales bacterium]|nr:Gfo/Idh/MocA family oxidoreductase [Pirellulales bacterium]
MSPIDRRQFVAGALAAGVMAGTRSRARAVGAGETATLALMGANNRGAQLADAFAKRPDVRIAYVCDVDDAAIAKGIKAVTDRGGAAPQGIKDFRRALDDPAIDGLICAAPNHWHATATVLACAAGKHVYVEKPCSQTPEEGELMIAAGRKASKAIQVGMQRRSGELYAAVKQLVADGAIGEALYAKSWYYRARPSIGRGREIAVPAGLDYDLWQGPAPERPYRDNVIHYNWHFFWHWGNGELGNNGVHTLDICRWVLGVDYPQRVTVAASKLRYDDDQQTPDTTLATFDCGDKMIAWESTSWSDPYQTGQGVGMEFRGSEGTIIVTDAGYTVYDLERKPVKTGAGSRGDDEHIANFLDGMRTGANLNADVVDGHKSALFCHLGNIAVRVGRSIDVDPVTGRITGDEEAIRYWAREEYRAGWNPREPG